MPGSYALTRVSLSAESALSRWEGPGCTAVGTFPVLILRKPVSKDEG